MVPPCRVAVLVASLALFGCNPMDDVELNLFGPGEPESENPAHPNSSNPVCFEGLVRSAVDTLPIADASVGGIGDHTITTKTNQLGYYSIRCAPHHGIRLLRARKDGWKPQEVRVEDIPGNRPITEPLEWDFYLEPE